MEEQILIKFSRTICTYPDNLFYLHLNVLYLQCFLLHVYYTDTSFLCIFSNQRAQFYTEVGLCKKWMFFHVNELHTAYF